MVLLLSMEKEAVELHQGEGISQVLVKVLDCTIGPD